MRAGLAQLRQAVATARGLAALVVTRALSLVLRAWRWLDSLDIPLSPLQWVLCFYIVFGMLYLLATPVMEASDEIWHFGYVQHLRETGELPVQDLSRRDTLYRQHGSQPPLYYWALAALTAPLNLDDAAQLRQLNPHALVNKPGAYGNKNLVTREDDSPQFAGASLAVLLARAVGLALGAGAIAFVYRIGELISPQRPTVAFVAAAITALNPMFIFVSASVNNDSLAMCLNGALVFLLLRTLRNGFSWRASLTMALLFALACLTKVTSLLLLPVIVVVALLVTRKTGDRRGLMLLLGALAACWLLICGWWLARNWQLYGEPLGILTQAALSGSRGMYFDLAELFAEYQQFRMSFWGLFGAANIQLANIFYVLLDLMTLLSFGGCVFLILQLLAISDFAYARYELAHLLTLALASAIMTGGLLYLSALTPVTQGRVLFPLIAVISPALAVGLVEAVWWLVFSLRPPNLDFVRAGDAVPRELLHSAMLWQLRALAAVACLAPLTVIAGQYSAPQPIAELPPRARPVYAEFGDVALVAYERVDRRYSAGDTAQFTLYWQVKDQSQSDYSLLLRLADDYQHTIGSYATYPGAGSLRTSSWRAGAIYPDKYLIPISGAAYGRYPFDLHVEWVDGGSGARIPAANADGLPIDPVLLDIGAVVSLRQQASASVFNEIPLDSQPVFDDAIRLEGYQLDFERNEIGLHWKADSAPTDNYTIFAHLLDADGEILTQADTPPRLPTRYWRWGETFTTFHQFPATPNMLRHRVVVGLYLADEPGYPKAEYVASPAQEAADAALDALPTPTEDLESDDPALYDTEAEVLLDAYAIDWAEAAEVLALTPTPEPTAEASHDGEPSETITTGTP